MSEQNKAAVRRLIEDHWNGKSAEHVAELFTPNATDPRIVWDQVLT